ncbi:MAG: hypothetical protein I3274_07985 [Candidatus Moeniiplasma glomeromycotorum]|nr:hypothetical protein [Candidatus Moeniiplasma glomeromycotorum]
MTENNTQQFIKQLADREGVAEEKIKEIIIESFRKSYCQGENSKAELHFEFDSGLSVYHCYKIVEKVSDPIKEISADNELLKKGLVKENNFWLPLDIKNFSFSLNQEIKDRLRKRVAEVSWERQFKFYKSQEGEIIKGNIKSTREKKYYLVDLGQVTGHWEKSEWTLRDEPRLGQRFYFLIKEVREKSDPDTPAIILTRTDDLFICKLLEQEIPQFKRKIIALHGILRLPGLISKIVVEKGSVANEKNLHIDPAGTCIGERGVRIEAVSRLIYPERIHVVNWIADKKKLLLNLLLPVKPVKLIIKQEKEWEIVLSQNASSSPLLKEISKYLGINSRVREAAETEKEEILANKGKTLQEVGNYKNIAVRIMEEN